MDKKILKCQWERVFSHKKISLNQAQELLKPYTSALITRLELLNNGCANTNYKVSFKNGCPVVLRFYQRDKTALNKEITITTWLQGKVPTPGYLYSNDKQDFIDCSYTIFEWVDGQVMREVMLQGSVQDIAECAYEAGIYLGVLNDFKFQQGGFFNKDMTLKAFSEQETLDYFLLQLLAKKRSQTILPKTVVISLEKIVKKSQHLPLKPQAANLVHADYDSSNILVKKIRGQWKIAAVLDWEFALASSYLLDMGLMLRYAHKLPACYESEFIKGILTSGIKLPKVWKHVAKLYDLLSLLTILNNEDIHYRQQTKQDVVALIGNMITFFNSSL
ncbi:MAG: hypothetical protein A3E87_10045 [Gammaproteobacteria bacterium RIFCSPHIGHO2_12_FULL_35_23]|nr:MAG: hypothetical protein A3E87_10045 [Gammaproteobacteria bacterium RIFCSPHIGHO2_12_FULL_35_23]